jgi:hypothetical protein
MNVVHCQCFCQDSGLEYFRLSSVARPITTTKTKTRRGRGTIMTKCPCRPWLPAPALSSESERPPRFATQRKRIVSCRPCLASAPRPRYSSPLFSSPLLVAPVPHPSRPSHSVSRSQRATRRDSGSRQLVVPRGGKLQGAGGNGATPARAVTWSQEEEEGLCAMAHGPAMAPAAGSGTSAASAAATAAAEEMRWRQLDSGVSAVSFGFVVTAILVSLFLAMAIIEHFLRPPARAPGPATGVLRRLVGRGGESGADLEAARKLDSSAPIEVRYTAHCSRTPHLTNPSMARRFNDSVGSRFLYFPFSCGFAFRVCAPARPGCESLPAPVLASLFFYSTRS